MMKSWMIITATSFFLQLFGVSWEAIDEKIVREYPAVNALEVADLATLLASTAKHPVIVDVREGREFAVSHLRAAENLSTAQEIARHYPDRETEIVVYCSVGYRSAEVAQQLIELGYNRVVNLRHSIFSWANQGLPLVNSSGETDKVHPYNRIWGSLLDANRHSYQP